MKTRCPLCRNAMPLLRSGVCVPCSDARMEHASRRFEDADRRLIDLEERCLQLRERVEEHRANALARMTAEVELQREARRMKVADAERRDEASKNLAVQSLLHYIERRDPNYSPGWVHELIARQLERFIEDVANKRSPRLILTVPSRAGKSELASNSFPAWLLGSHPEMNVILASYSDELPIRFSRSIRAQIQSPDYAAVFPSGARMAPHDQAAKAWSTEQGGGFRATGVGGGLLGFGADVIIVDDPVKDVEEADNPAALEKVWDWFTSVCMSRLMPGAGIVVIMQRMAELDLVGRIKETESEESRRVDELRTDAATLEVQRDRLLETGETAAAARMTSEMEVMRTEADELEESMDRWHIIEYPALAKHDEYLSPAGDIVRDHGQGIPKTWRKLRSKGEALHPERYTRHYYLKLKRANPRRFAAMYQLEPVAEGAEYFSEDDFVRYRVAGRPKNLAVYCAWDLAVGQKQTNDFTVGVAMGVNHDGKHYLLEYIKGRYGDLEGVADLVIDLHKRWNAVQTGVERTHLEIALLPVLRRHMRARKEFITLTEGQDALRPIVDKRVRARTLQGLARAGMLYVPEGQEWDDFIRVLCRFPGSSHDDEVDAAAWAAIVSARHGVPRDPARDLRPPDEFKSWYDELVDEMTGDGTTYLGA